MNTNYYYLLSSLPSLKFDEDLVILKQDFIDECDKWLLKKDVNKIKHLSDANYIVARGDISFIVDWKQFNKELQENINVVRKSNLDDKKVKVPEHLNFLEEENPLLLETAIEKYKWNFIKEHELKYYFDFNCLIMYYLKICILERLQSFNKIKGEKIFYNLCEVKYE